MSKYSNISEKVKSEMKAIAENPPPVKPVYLPVKPDGIPDNIKHLKTFVCWRAELNTTGNKWTKPPYQPDGRKAKSTGPETWTDFETCLKACQPGIFDGLGIICDPDTTGITGFDFDHCIKNGIINPEVQNFIETLGSYAEISPSGDGVHVFCFGKKPGEQCKQTVEGYEIYDSGRYLTLTGHALKALPVADNCQDRIDAVYNAIFPPVFIPQVPAPAMINTEREFLDLSDSDLLDKARAAKNGSKFISLYDHGEKGDDHSAADMALCGILAYWTGRDAGRLDRLFRASALMRPKWDEKRYSDGRTYGQGTIQRAIAGCDTVYTGPQDTTVHTSPRTPVNIPPEPVQPHEQAPEIIPPVKINVFDYLYDNEVGDARLYQELYSGKRCYDHAAGQWHVWTGHKWELDGKASYLKAFESVVDAYKAERDSLNQIKPKTDRVESRIEALSKRIHALQTVKRRKSVLELARSGEDSLGIAGTEWDRNGMLFACKNGVIDLESGEMTPGNPLDYIRKGSDVEWKGLDEPAPIWEKTLNQIFGNDSEMVSFINRLFGYCMTGNVSEHYFPVFYGPKGRNGKGTLLETIGKIMGPLSGPVSQEFLIEQRIKSNSSAPSPDKMALMGRRLAWASETAENAKLDFVKLKMLTGGDSIVAREVHGKRQVEFSPTHKIILLTNYKPQASDSTDGALWDRMLLIPFVNRFVRNPDGPNAHRMDKDLPEKLKAEYPGILAWLVRGCLAWQREGLTPPEKIQTATENFRNESDVLADFFGECLVEDKASRILRTALYKAYQTWGGTIRKTIFFQKIRDRGFSETTIRGYDFFCGVRGKTQEEKEAGVDLVEKVCKKEYNHQCAENINNVSRVVENVVENEQGLFGGQQVVNIDKKEVGVDLVEKNMKKKQKPKSYASSTIESTEEKNVKRFFVSDPPLPPHTNNSLVFKIDRVVENDSTIFHPNPPESTCRDCAHKKPTLCMKQVKDFPVGWKQDLSPCEHFEPEVGDNGNGAKRQ